MASIEDIRASLNSEADTVARTANGMMSISADSIDSLQGRVTGLEQTTSDIIRDVLEAASECEGAAIPGSMAHDELEGSAGRIANLGTGSRGSSYDDLAARLRVVAGAADNTSALNGHAQVLAEAAQLLEQGFEKLGQTAMRLSRETEVAKQRRLDTHAIVQDIKDLSGRV